MSETPEVRVGLSRPAAARAPRRYVHDADGWRIVSGSQDEDPLWRSTDGVALPERLHALAPSDGAAVASWRAQVQGPQVQGPQVQETQDKASTTLTLMGMTGPTRRERGATLDIEHPLAVPALLPPGIAASAPQQFARLSIDWTADDRSADGHNRSNGNGNGNGGDGKADSWLITLPDEQRLLVWARSGQDGGAAPTPAPLQTRVRVESDGRVLDPGSWRAGFAALDRGIAEAIDRLGERWRSAEAVSSTRIAARPALLAAESGVAWGYRAGASLDLAPTMHMTGHLQGILCRWDLSWHGVVDIAGARARVRIDVVDDPALADFHRDWDLPWSHDADPAVLPWVPMRLPLRLTFEPLASATGAFVSDIDWAGKPPALVGGVGLRPSARGNGLEWAFTAALEPVVVRVGLSAPWSGRREQMLDWLPALTLFDWRCDA
ncbi:hypothetical protein PV762_05030 [Mitsuaria sp. CC2]|uniref:hypothetical protein n=1 Tax=Mitsuaria sp. CC2 TaxID=3029186 RepID=UPI003B8E7927